MIYLIIYIVLGILVAGLTFIFTDEDASADNIMIGVVFWPLGVIWFFLRLMSERK